MSNPIDLSSNAKKFKEYIENLDTNYISSTATKFKFIYELINDNYDTTPNVPDYSANNGILRIDGSNKLSSLKIEDDTFTDLLKTSLIFDVANIKTITAAATDASSDNNSDTSDTNILKFVDKGGASIARDTSGASPADIIYVKNNIYKILNIVSSINVLNIFIDILEAYKDAIENDTYFKTRADVDEVKHIFIVNKHARPVGKESSDNSGYYLKNATTDGYMLEGNTLFLSINSYQQSTDSSAASGLIYNHLFQDLSKVNTISGFQSDQSTSTAFDTNFEVSSGSHLFDKTGSGYTLKDVGGVKGKICAYYTSGASAQPTHVGSATNTVGTNTPGDCKIGDIFKVRDKFLIETFIRNIFDIEISKRRETINALYLICTILKQILLLSISSCNLLFNSIFKSKPGTGTLTWAHDATTFANGGTSILNLPKSLIDNYSSDTISHKYYIIDINKINNVENIKDILNSLYYNTRTENIKVPTKLLLDEWKPDSGTIAASPSYSTTRQYIEYSIWNTAFQRHEDLTQEIESKLDELYKKTISNAGIYTGSDFAINTNTQGFVIKVKSEDELILHHPDFLYDKIFKSNVYETIKSKIEGGTNQLSLYFSLDDIKGLTDDSGAANGSGCSYTGTPSASPSHTNVNGFTFTNNAENDASNKLNDCLVNENYNELTKDISDWGIVINNQAFHIKEIVRHKAAGGSMFIESITIGARIKTKIKGSNKNLHVPQLKLGMDINRDTRVPECGTPNNAATDMKNKPYTIINTDLSYETSIEQESTTAPKDLTGKYILVRAGAANNQYNLIKFVKLNKSNIKDKYNLSKLQLVDTNNKINNYETKIKNYNTLYEYNNNKNSILSNSYISYLVIVSVLIIALLFTYVNNTDNSIKKLIAIICFSIIILLFIVYFIFNTLYIEENFYGREKLEGASTYSDNSATILDDPVITKSSGNITSHTEFATESAFINAKKNYVENGLINFHYEFGKILTISGVAISAVGENKANEELRRIITKETSLRTGIKTKLSNISNGSTSEIDLLKYEREIYEVKIKTILMMGLLFSGLYTINLYTNGVFAESLIYIGLLLFIIIMSYYLIYSSNVVRTRSNNIYWGKMNINKYKSI
jgi:hypothetical protein